MVQVQVELQSAVKAVAQHCHLLSLDLLGDLETLEVVTVAGIEPSDHLMSVSCLVPV